MSAEKKWFILENEQVQGPFTTGEVEAKLLEVKTPPLIWWRGIAEWVRLEKWQQELRTNPAYSRDREVQDRRWKMKIQETEYPESTMAELVQQLKKINDLSQVRVWTEGYSEWKEVFQIHKIMDDLGVSRRQHVRVPIQGQMTYETSEGTFTAKLVTISEGGCGIVQSEKLSMGSKVKGTIQSAQLFQSLNVSCEVLYIGYDGYAGMRFLGLHTEVKSAIIEYVKKFGKQTKT
jgi:hypothetical protein